MRAAAWIARKHVYWFSTVWIATNSRLPLKHAWLIRVGDQCAIRVLQKFAVREPKLQPLKPGEFQRGPALKYNRWLRAGQPLPFDHSEAIHVGPVRSKQIVLPGTAQTSPIGREQNNEGVFLGDWQ